MPGYIMHLTEAERILSLMREKTEVSDSWAQAFLAGSLMPDTRLKEEKCISHFWPASVSERPDEKPDLMAFREKYSERLDDPLVMGYLAHLHLDAHYLSDYWPTVIVFLDAKGHMTTQRAEVTDVFIRQSGKVVPVDTFFTPQWYYGEYGKLNGYFISHYHLQVPHWQKTLWVTPEEVNLDNYMKVQKRLEWMIREVKPGAETELQIFSLVSIEVFLRFTASEFLRTYHGDLSISKTGI